MSCPIPNQQEHLRQLAACYEQITCWQASLPQERGRVAPFVRVEEASCQHLYAWFTALETLLKDVHRHRRALPGSDPGGLLWRLRHVEEPLERLMFQVEQLGLSGELSERVRLRRTIWEGLALLDRALSTLREGESEAFASYAHKWHLTR